MDEDDIGKQNKQQQANKQVAKKLPSSINIDVVTSSNSSGKISFFSGRISPGFFDIKGQFPEKFTFGALQSTVKSSDFLGIRFNILILERGLKMIHKISGVAPPPGKTQPKQIKVSIQSPPNAPQPADSFSVTNAGCKNNQQQAIQQPAAEKENREVRISVLSTDPARQQIPAISTNQIPVFLANQIPILTPSQLGVLNLGISNPKIDQDCSTNQNSSAHPCLRPSVGGPLEPYFSIAGTSSNQISIRRVF